MSSRTWVAPPEPDVLVRLSGQPVVLRLDDAAALATARAIAARAGVDVRCLDIHSDTALTGQEITDAWDGIPVALRVPRLGPFIDLRRILPRLRALDLRVLVPANQTESLRDARILASLGVACGVVIEPGVPWSELSDLATYALLGPVPHAPLSPFSELADRYVPHAHTDFGFTYFEDPRRFLHLDRAGHVALSAGDLAAERYVAESPDASSAVEDHPRYRERVEGWRALFMQAEGCSVCAGFRLCLGRLKASGDGCSAFASDLMDVLEQHQARARKPRSRWQP